MSMGPAVARALEIVAFGIDLAQGRVADPAVIGRKLAGYALDFVPVDDLREYLTEEARRRADLAADLAEKAKFGG